MLQLFTTPTCPQCQRVKDLFTKNGIDFEQIDLTTSAGLTELRTLDIWELQAPILVQQEEPLKYLTAKEIEPLSDEALIAAISP
mgnify:CR=1 FL=1